MFVLVYTGSHPKDPYAAELLYKQFSQKELFIYLHRNRVNEDLIEKVDQWCANASPGEFFETYLTGSNYKGGVALVLCVKGEQE